MKKWGEVKWSSGAELLSLDLSQLYDRDCANAKDGYIMRYIR